MTTFIVRSARNPKLILCTSGEFRAEITVGPGGFCAKTFKTRAGAGKTCNGKAVIVEELDTHNTKPIQWLTTAPSPDDSLHGENGGQHGWKHHAVKAADVETFKDIGKRPAVCGLKPAHGWALDLFIPEDPQHKCKNCSEKLPTMQVAVNADLLGTLKLVRMYCPVHVQDGIDKLTARAEGRQP